VFSKGHQNYELEYIPAFEKQQAPEQNLKHNLSTKGSHNNIVSMFFGAEVRE